MCSALLLNKRRKGNKKYNEFIFRFVYFACECNTISPQLEFLKSDKKD